MARRVTPNIPQALHRDDRDTVTFLQSILDRLLVVTGMRIKWGSTELPPGGFLFLDGSTVSKSDYGELWAFAQNDASFSTTDTTVTLPNDAGFVVKV